MIRKFKNFLFGTLTGSASQYYDGTGAFSTPSVTATKQQITVVIDGAGSAITTGTKAYLSVPINCTITKWRVLSSDAAATSGSVTIDIWKDTYANYPPTVADTIIGGGGTKPNLSTQSKNESSTLTGWTTSISAGDILGFNVDLATTVTRVTLSLEIQPT